MSLRPRSLRIFHHALVERGTNPAYSAVREKCARGCAMRYEKGYMDFTRPPPPVAEGDILTVKIEGIGSSGDGLAHVKGFVIFVPETSVDDEVRVRITKVSRRVGFAERIEEEAGQAQEQTTEPESEPEPEKEPEPEPETGPEE